jgi:DNA-binding protein H-NS
MKKNTRIKLALVDTPGYDGLEDYRERLETAIEQCDELQSILDREVSNFISHIFTLGELMSKWEIDEEIFGGLDVGQNMLKMITDASNAVSQIDEDLSDIIDELEDVEKEF